MQTISLLVLFLFAFSYAQNNVVDVFNIAIEQLELLSFGSKVSRQVLNCTLLDGATPGSCIDSSSLSSSISFCKDYVGYGKNISACVLGGDVEIDKEIEYIFKNTSQGLKDDDKCRKAYTQFLCSYSFPKCNEDGSTQKVCRHLCEVFFYKCGSSGENFCNNENSDIGSVVNTKVEGPSAQCTGLSGATQLTISVVSIILFILL